MRLLVGERALGRDEGLAGAAQGHGGRVDVLVVEGAQAHGVVRPGQDVGVAVAGVGRGLVEGRGGGGCGAAEECLVGVDGAEFLVEGGERVGEESGEREGEGGRGGGGC